MADVLQFKPREQQVQPAEPKCGTVPIPDGQVWQCGTCGNQLFYITLSGYVCSHCGGFRGMSA